MFEGSSLSITEISELDSSKLGARETGSTVQNIVELLHQ